MNPFKFGQVVSGSDFCGREGLIDQLLEKIEVGQNCLIQGERRVGKTSLLMEVASRSRKKGLFIDLMEIKTIDEMCERMLRALASLRGKHFMSWVFDTLGHLRPAVTMNTETGQPSLSFQSVDFRVQSIHGILELIEKTNKHTPLVVIFDEFQDVLNLEDSRRIQAELRSKIQYQADMTYFFAGSIRNRMDDIFNHHDSPFYKSALTFTVEPLPFEVFVPFLIKRFDRGKRRVDEVVFRKIFEIAQNIPGDIQQLCEAMWSLSGEGEALTEEKMHEAVRIILSRERKVYEMVIAGLTVNQAKVLRTIAAIGGRQPTSKKFLAEAGDITSAGVLRALKRLEDTKILYRTAEGYKFSNTFFRAWMLNREAV